MLELLDRVVLKLIEQELVKLSPDAQDFVLKELKIFSDMLIKYIEEKMAAI